MRLINLDTLQLEIFTADDSIPPFAILSHTWADGEVTLQDVTTLPGIDLGERPGWRKIAGFCKAVKEHMLKLTSQTVSYGWVDTCCIDKTSSAELSEAINSMFRWYRNAVACFAFLSDIDALNSLGGSRWFRRGWTLQELLAPRELFFFGKDWVYQGNKIMLGARISYITGIDRDVVSTGSWDSCCVAERMSWASRRQTTRAEDMAYCLMGIFDVNMPLLYGEGGEKAFLRLQEEILKQSEDQSIFAWDASKKDSSVRDVGALATSPSYFYRGGMIETLPYLQSRIALTPTGVEAQLPILKRNDGSDLALLACRHMMDLTSMIGIPVKCQSGGTMPTSSGRNATLYTVSTSFTKMQVYSRTREDVVEVTVSSAAARQLSPTLCLMRRDRLAATSRYKRLKCWLCYSQMRGLFTPEQSSNYGWKNSPDRSMTRPLGMQQQGVRWAVLFEWYRGLDEHYRGPAHSFWVILDITRGVLDSNGECDNDGAVRVGLMKRRDKESEHSMLQRMEDEKDVVLEHNAELHGVLPGSIVRAKADVIEDETIFRIDLSMHQQDGKAWT